MKVIFYLKLSMSKFTLHAKGKGSELELFLTNVLKIVQNPFFFGFHKNVNPAIEKIKKQIIIKMECFAYMTFDLKLFQVGNVSHNDSCNII